MKEFLEKALRQTVCIEENKELYDRLPLAYKGKYIIYNVKTNGLLWIAISPKSEVGLVMLRKDRSKVENVANLNCALFLESVTFYIKEKLMEEGIPFVIKGKQIYLPFIGYLLVGAGERELAPVHQISFLTQKLLLTAIYEKMTELLAPAGNIEALDAAIGEGADAVYMGLKSFNARLRSSNFAWNQFEAAVQSVHRLFTPKS